MVKYAVAFIFLVTNLSVYSQSIQYDKDSNIYQISNKSCSSIREDLEELYRQSISDFQCKCSSNTDCNSTVDLNLLPKKISYLLKNRVLKTDGPNCYNSVMYLAGIVPGLYFSTSEVQLWLDSNFCKNIDANSAKAGDLVSFQSYEGNSGHIMMYLSDKIYFNKSMGGIADPYELVDFKEYIDQYWDGSGKKYLSKCINLTVEQAMNDKDCRSKYTTIYRCNSFEEEFSEQIKRNEEIWSMYNNWGDCLNEYFLAGNDNLISQIKIMMKILSTYAKNEALIPSFKDLPSNLQILIKESHSGFSSNDYDLLAAKFYISSHTKMNARLNEIEKAFQAQFRKNNINISTKEMMFWANIYLGTSRDKVGWSD